ncbi:MAG: hypothetical protein ACR2OM_08330 [Aestuariivirgaceae bacterium]
MQTPPQPRPAFINNDPELGDRFWYWYGASGRRYIHSVYPAGHCPVLPDAVYISVRRVSDRQFVPVAVDMSGPLCHFKDRSAAAGSADEVHVHLLACDHVEAVRICNDLQAGVLPEMTSNQSRPLRDTAALQLSLLAGNEGQSGSPIQAV